MQLFTHSPMTGLAAQDGGWCLTTPRGRIVAKRVGLTTDAYSMGAVPKAVTRGFFPLDCYGIASRPLTDTECKAIMPSGMNLGDTHRDPMFFRIDAMGRIVTGGLLEPKRGRDFAYTADFMTRRIARFFPRVDALSWEHMWNGKISMALDQIPSIQRLDDGLWQLSGWSGRGVPTSAALSVCFAKTLQDERLGAQYWPHRQPPTVYARGVVGQMVQLCRGPFNQLRDRMKL